LAYNAAGIAGLPRRLTLGRILLALIVAATAAFLAWEKPWDPTQPIRLQHIAISVGGVNRQFLLYDPHKLARPPLVIVIHGGGSMAARAVRMSRFDTLAAREGFMVAYPDGTGPTPWFFHTWNASHCCLFALAHKSDDVAFLGVMIDHLIASRSVDPARVYVTGLSVGGMMAHKAGIELTDKIAAVAPVVGALFGDEPAPRGPLPVMMIQGANDAVVPNAGGPLGAGRKLGDRDIIPASAAAAYWAKADGCRNALTDQSPQFVLQRWEDCSEGTEVLLYTIAGGGHAWPGEKKGPSEKQGPGEKSDPFDATSQIWAFFKRHQKAR
jgi:polyhydroxybutyrate depolymerase